MARRLALSVSQLNEYVRRLLQQDPLLYEVELTGEISNLKFHQTGTLFFTLKDEHAAISCVMYAQEAFGLQVEPFDGMRAIVTGSVGLYAKSGQYQFYTKSIRAQGLGVLYERYQILKDRLEREGLFSAERKRPIPGFSDTVGVVTSPTGAVIHDIMSVSLRRDPDARILLCPVRVQGADAADEVVGAIRLLEQLDSVSVIIVARGGGSIEDLWTFNEERVVRAVASCKKPVVSAVGHETDFTLCDFAADLRAPTPSAAAECVVPVRADVQAQLEWFKTELYRNAADAVKKADASLSIAKAHLSAQHPARRLAGYEEKLAALSVSLRHAATDRLNRVSEYTAQKKREIELLSPYAVLERGYAIALKTGKSVRSASDIDQGDCLDLLLKDGKIIVQALK